ncbi:MAG: excinuclease ABC subunit UvrA, partial [Acutalibacteraceae bacterium]|nr:excinuclease ABC subunit UvrA [Acutalibacteraceae bacterium]
EHNLKNIDVEIPRDKLIVFTGLSGSGKSSLAFDTIYAEGQRRYVESLSSYARQFLGQMEKPNVDSIEGLSPAISIDQKTTSKNPRSTVGTVTEIYDYLRLLYARVGIPHCPVCGKEISQQTTDQIVDTVMKLDEGSRIQILSPIVKGRKGEHVKELENARKSGYSRVRIDGNIYDLSEEIKLEKNKKHMIEIVVDRLVIKEEIRSRLSESIETAASVSGGLVAVDVIGGEELQFSQSYACDEHGISVPELTPTMFSFNNPFGACPTCTGIGMFMKVNPKLLINDDSKSLLEGAIKASGWGVNTWFNPDAGAIAAMYYKGIADRFGFDINIPFRDIPEDAKQMIFYGSGEEKLKLVRNSELGGGIYYAPFEGVVNNLERRYKTTSSDYSREEIESLMTESECPDCHGARLKPEYLAVTIGNKNIKEFCDMSVNDALKFISELKFSQRNEMIAKPILKEVCERLSFLQSVGLDYLTLSRSSGTLSGGESQRIRLATQIGSSLVGVLYILDEPSIGLHQRDNDRLLATLKKLRDLGNTLIVVEHDEDTMRAADYIVDIGPGAGIHGGNVVCSGTLSELEKCTESITSDYLTGRKQIPVPQKRRKGNGLKLSVKGAAENNLKNINVDIPLGEFVCVTGVSGSGKSSFVNDIVYKVLAAKLNRAKTIPGKFKSVEGIENLDKVIDIDQSPIGRTPRSNPATYTGVFNDIRELFAQTKDAKAHGYSAGRFSFNVKGGRCEACQGDGILKIEMHFLPDIYVPCEVCGGSRYNRETLNIKYKGKNIYDVLEMTVEEGMNFFESVPKIHRKLKTLFDVGLGYVKIGQSATTLSGGEAQRVKLATELSKRSTGKTIYILD